MVKIFLMLFVRPAFSEAGLGKWGWDANSKTIECQDVGQYTQVQCVLGHVLPSEG